MKIKMKTMKNFLKKIQLDDSLRVEEVVLFFKPEGLQVNLVAMNNSAGVKATLNNIAFKEYEDIGNIGINDLSNFIKVIERFGEEIEIKKQGNLLVLKEEGKKVEIELINEEAVNTTNKKELTLEHIDKINLQMKTIKNVFDDVKMNKDFILTLTTQEQKIEIKNTGKYKFTHNIESEGTKGGVTVKFGAPFIDAIKRLEEDLEIKVATDYPCLIIEETDMSKIEIIVAPRVGDD